MHSVHRTVYDEKCDRKKIEEYWNEEARNAGRKEGGSGLPNPIQWLDRIPIKEDYDAAVKYIDAVDNQHYGQLAVRFYETPVTSSKSLDKAEDDVNKAIIHLNALQKQVLDDFSNCKSEYVSCKDCGSKLKRSLLKGNKGKVLCPLCSSDLVSDTAKKRLENASNKVTAARNKHSETLRQVKKKNMKNRVVMWLVKTEYHT